MSVDRACGPAVRSNECGSRLLIVRAAARELLEDAPFADAGFAVRGVADDGNVLAAVREWRPLGILLDVPLAGAHAQSTIASLRRVTDAPIVAIATERSKIDTIAALGCGADQVVRKPFDAEVLAALMRAAIRRPVLEWREVVSCADIVVDVASRRVARAGRQLELSAREFDMLLALARRPGEVVSRMQLLDIVWGRDRDVTAGCVDTYVSYVRAKVDVVGMPALIRTVRGVGYALRAAP